MRAGETIIKSMKNILFVALAGCLPLLSGCGEKLSWTELTKFDGGVAYHLVSTSNAQKKTEPLSGSLRWVYEQPQHLHINDSTEVNYIAKEATIFLNCASHTFAMPDYSFHNTAKVVHWVSDKPDEIKWQALKSDAVGCSDRLFQYRILFSYQCRSLE
jgi:hypothetical protein